MADEQQDFADNPPPPASAVSPTDTRRYPEPAAATSNPSAQPVSSRDRQTGDFAPYRLNVRTSGPLAASRSHVQSPEPNSAASARRPNASRRISSSRHHTSRGQEFSVDDAREEISAGAAAQRQARFATGSLRRLPSAARQRQAPPLPPPLESENSGDTEQRFHGGASATKRDGRTSSDEEGTLQPDPEDQDADVEDLDADADANGNGDVDDDDDDDDNDDDGGDDNASEVSDAESFTLRDRQNAINETHPFGIRIWKPALYKKSRSVEKGAEGDIHSTPGGMVPGWLRFFNLLWTLLFGWWLAFLAAAGALLCHLLIFWPGCGEYGEVLWGLARYIFYPFGKYVKLIQEEAYADEDHGEGRSITEYEQWQSGDIEEGRLFFGPIRSLIGRRRSDEDSEDGENEPLLARNGAEANLQNDRTPVKRKKRLFGRGQWTVGRVIFFIFFYGGLTPSLFLVSGICWLFVFSIPMARVTLILFHHLRRHPLALEFHSDSTDIRQRGAPPSAILLCTYRAVGTKYWKYTIGGTNIFLINLLAVVAFVIFDYFVLYEALGIRIFLTNTIFVFLLALFSIIPLAYFIGQAVASISAQSTMGVGAAINAFFSTVVEVFLYCIALKEGKAALVEGSIIGSIFAGILLLPGLSMCFGALKRKTQRFNVKSAGVTTTMLLFAMIGSFGPTLFYQIYGSHELNCHDCVDDDGTQLGRDCRRCFFAQIPAIHDPFFESTVQPYIWFSALLLFLSYVIGLLFTLRTHAATIWEIELDEKKPDKQEPLHQRPHLPPKAPSIDYGTIATTTGRQSHSGVGPKADIRDSQLYRRILGQSLNQAGLAATNTALNDAKTPSAPPSIYSADGEVHEVASLPTAPSDSSKGPSVQIKGLSAEQSSSIVQHMAEMAATAAAVAARDMSNTANQTIRRASALTRTSSIPAQQHQQHQQQPQQQQQQQLQRVATNARANHGPEDHGATAESGGHGHDAPNWSRSTSCIVLLSATVAYAVIAEILVDTVDSVLQNIDIDEKFVGITLFALVPNTTEFLNAISFAINGNIALSMEIGSAYALQVCLLQVPALVLFSAIYPRVVSMSTEEIIKHSFSMIFPQWDLVTVILCTFLLAYMYGEGKSNYFKGSILILAYLVVLVGLYASGFSNIDVLDPNEPSVNATKAAMRRYKGGAKVLVLRN